MINSFRFVIESVSREMSQFANMNRQCGRITRKKKVGNEKDKEKGNIRTNLEFTEILAEVTNVQNFSSVLSLSQKT